MRRAATASRAAYITAASSSGVTPSASISIRVSGSLTNVSNVSGRAAFWNIESASRFARPQLRPERVSVPITKGEKPDRFWRRDEDENSLIGRSSE